MEIAAFVSVKTKSRAPTYIENPLYLPNRQESFTQIYSFKSSHINRMAAHQRVLLTNCALDNIHPDA